MHMRNPGNGERCLLATMALLAVAALLVAVSGQPAAGFVLFVIAVTPFPARAACRVRGVMAGVADAERRETGDRG